ncbi:hypothetical protein FKP32DRAFT_1755426 [Trametes sanguinea]|nr:hypothetical protein FKP32DRAFT_1755426 [Trametes sanguinea]
MMMHMDILVYVRTHKMRLGFEDVFAVPAREDKLLRAIRKKCSAARTLLRDKLIASVTGKGRKSLEDTTVDILKTMKKGGLGSADIVKAEYQIRFALLRRWTREEYGLSLPPSRRGAVRLPTEGEDDSPPDSSTPASSPSPMEHGTEAPAAKKRKISDVNELDMPIMPPTVGKVPKGEDFWSKMDMRLADKENEWGLNIKISTEWRASSQIVLTVFFRYIDETVSRDRHVFGSSAAILAPLPLSSLPQASASLSVPSGASAGHMASPSTIPAGQISGAILQGAECPGSPSMMASTSTRADGDGDGSNGMML